MNTAYRPEVDGLRGIAVAVVILYHAGASSFSGGYIGVDVFFVISGYLITSILCSDHEAGRFSFRKFYERRARRIFPALFFVMLACLPFAWLWLTPAQLKEFFQSVVAVTLFVSNAYFWFRSGYFGEAAETIPLIHTWSLAVEEQFYVVYPIVLLLLWRFGKARLFTVLAGLAAASLAGCLVLEWKDPALNFFLSPTRAWELLAGALVALRGAEWTAGRLGNARAREVVSALGLVLVLWPAVAYDRATPFPGVYAIAPVFGSALLLCFCTPATRVGRVLASRPFVKVGLLSYSAYLWHQPLFAFARNVSTGHPPAALFAGLIALTLALSYLSWRFVETPFRRPGTVSRGRIVWLSAAASAGFLALGFAGHRLDGYPGRYDQASNEIAQSRAPSPLRDKCHTEGADHVPAERACRYFEGPATWAVFGDSHGVEIAYALAERLRPAGQSVLHLTFSGCPPALGFEARGAGCSRWIRETTAYLEANPQIGNIVLVFRHAFHLYGEQLQAYPGLPDNAPSFIAGGTPQAARAAYWASLYEIVRRLHTAGKTVYVLDPIPELGSSIDRIIYKRDIFGRANGGDAGAPLSYYERRNEAVLAQLAAPEISAHAKRIRARDAVCDATECYSVIDGKSMYFDDNHLSVDGARRLVRLIPLPEAAAPAAAR